MRKLHLGCWKRDWPGFTNVDLADFPHIHHKRNVDDLGLFQEGSFDVVYASHVLEYFPLRDVPRVLAQWRRVLAPAGRLYVAVPDFDGLAKAYQKFADVRLVQGPLFGHMEVATANGATAVLGHKVIYDFKLLRAVLEENGFSGVRRYAWEEIVPAGSEDHSMAHIPSRDYRQGISVSLNVTAVKANAAVAAALAGKQRVLDIGLRAMRKAKKLLP